MRKMYQIPSFISLSLLVFFTSSCLCVQYKVGDLNAWGIPPSTNPNVYSLWSQAHKFQLYDTLLFLYPPSQDAVLQVTEKAYNNCAVSDPILRIDDGNSIFNLTHPGRFYFISGIAAHCLKNQKLTVDVPSANGTFFPPAEGPAGAAMGPDAASPMYPVVFGPSAAQSSDAVSARVSGTVAILFAGVMLFWYALF
ncbi:Early nodulin-like protein 1 [Rhynchospora pubera]|uniref:Early nodulin-like protein 1 n=1 Tax=Rhynchospora pubera TaxID=906938 RepID=A0AAV8EGP8_9POAL|nr:Early nodulin-like protein 1 [Rhynchospora pubera]